MEDVKEIQSSQNDSKKEIINVNASMADLKKTIENGFPKKEVRKAFQK